VRAGYRLVEHLAGANLIYSTAVSATAEVLLDLRQSQFDSNARRLIGC
jgi:hypothetical protein